MKCTCCGKEVSISDRYCQNCGQNNFDYVEPDKSTLIDEEKKTQNISTQTNTQPNRNYNNYQNSYQNNYIPSRRVVYAYKEESKAVAILALIFSILGGWLGLILGIIGLCTYQEDGNKGMCKAAVIIFVVEVVIEIILIIVMATVLS